MTTRIILADDHQIFRQALGQALTTGGKIELVGEAGNGQEAITMAAELSPDILVMDIGMPRLNGIDAAQRILSENSKIRIIILSIFSEQDQITRALRAGVHGYVLKSSAMTELQLAISAVSDGNLYLSPRVLQPIVKGYLAWADQQGTSPLSQLTARERQVLQLIAEGKSSTIIARELELGIRTVESHRAKLMSKMDFRNVVDLVHFAIQHKLITPKR